MANRRVTPNMTGVVLKPGARYMVNTKTQNLYPYSEVFMEKNPDLQEVFPEFREPKKEDKPDVVPEVIDIGMTEPVDIDEIIVDIPPAPEPVPEPEPEPEPAPLKPWQKAQAAKKSKAAIIEG